MDGGVVGALDPSFIMKHSFCAACTKHLQKSMTAGRRKIWDELPGFFDLPGAS
jgi:hypothetical protein